MMIIKTKCLKIQDQEFLDSDDISRRIYKLLVLKCEVDIASVEFLDSDNMYPNPYLKAFI